MAAPKTISRFGRTYVAYDPDGAGGGPSTWILTSAGAGSSSGPSTTPSGTFTPATPGVQLHTGMAVYFSAPATLDLALARDAAGAGPAHPYEVAGLANADASATQLVGVITDGQVSLSDWTAVTGSKELLPGKRYYLSASDPGQLTVSCPTGPGVTVLSVGQAISVSALEVEINLMVRL